MTGTEGAWVPYVLAAVSAAAQYKGAEEERDDRRSILNRSLEQTQDATDKAADALTKEGDKFNPAQRAEAMQAAEAAALAQAQSDAANSGIVNTAGDAGRTSSTFQAAKDAASSAEGNRISALAQEIARTRAPGQLLQEEGLRRGALAGEIASTLGSASNLAKAAGLDAQNVGPSGWSTGGALVGAAGQAYGAGSTGSGTGYVDIGNTANDSSGYIVPGRQGGQSARAGTNRVFGSRA